MFECSSVIEGIEEAARAVGPGRRRGVQVRELAARYIRDEEMATTVPKAGGYLPPYQYIPLCEDRYYAKGGS